MNPPLPAGPRPARYWVWGCALLNIAGWLLSALHALNLTGYLAVFVITAVALVVWRGRLGLAAGLRFRPRKLRGRFSRWLPASFLILASLAFVGGCLHAPGNYDALAYRTPRVLHWLAEERWHWIPTAFERLNTRGTGMEWITAPLLLFTHTDRCLFLINAVNFVLLPGLFFGVLRGLGVSGGVAARWMWVLPTGYCYLLQAGSVGNDLAGATLALAAVDFALRARRSGRTGDVWTSTLAAALLGAVKASNLLLGLPWLVAIAPTWRLWLKRPFASALVLAAALASSFVPMAALNRQHSGDWTGAKAEGLPFTGANPLVRLAGNTGIVLTHHLLPPIAPFANTWNKSIAPKLVPAGLQRGFDRDFQTETASLFSIGELEIEEGAGAGFGLTMLLGIAVIAAWRLSRRSEPRRMGGGMRLVFGGAVVIALLLILMTSFVKSTGRLLTPFYGLALLPLLYPAGQAWVVRRRGWRLGVQLNFALALLLLALNPARPLFPVNASLALARGVGLPESLCVRAETVYSVYARRARAFDPALAIVPSPIAVLGMVSYDDPEAALWRPFHSRRVRHVTAKDTPATLATAGVHQILIGSHHAERVLGRPLEEWLRLTGGRVTRTIPLQLRAADSPRDWHLVELPATPP